MNGVSSYLSMTSELDRIGGWYERRWHATERSPADRAGLAPRDSSLHRGRVDRAGDPARQLGADVHNRLAPGRRPRSHESGRRPQMRPAPRPPSTPVGMSNRVRELRTEKGLSQGELAAAVDVSRQTINSIEQERYTPSLPLALALARYFGSTVEEMFDADH